MFESMKELVGKLKFSMQIEESNALNLYHKVRDVHILKVSSFFLAASHRSFCVYAYLIIAFNNNTLHCMEKKKW